MRPHADGVEDLSLLAIANGVLRQRWTIAAVTALACALVVALSLLAPKQYTATASFLTQRPGAPSSVASLAVQLGAGRFLGPESGLSPQFYVDLLESREILEIIANDTGETSAGQADELSALLKIDGSTNAATLEESVKKLRKMIDASVAPKTGVISVDVTAQSPRVAYFIVTRLLDELQRFNMQARQSQAVLERRFTERRLQEVRQDLRSYEDELQSFLQANRNYQNSPSLVFRHDRLAREIALRQQLYVTVAQAVEQARVEEVRDTPVLTVVERPRMPALPNGPNLLVRSLAGIALGLGLGLIAAYIRERLREASARGTSELSEFVDLRRRALWELKHPIRAVGAARRRAPGDHEN